MGHLIGPDALSDLLEGDRPVRLLDVRWRLDLPEGRPAYLRAHLPGAVYVDLEGELARPADPAVGRYPEPELVELQDAARRWGLDDGDLVVVYDDNDGVAAARAWWLLRRHGVKVQVLDGGIRGWVANGSRLESGDRVADRGAITLRVDRGASAGIDDAARAPANGYLVDVRSPEQYRGKDDGRDPSSGHIPGAINLPTVAHIGGDGRLRPAAEIAATIAASGIDRARPVVLYCSVGIASAHSALAFAEVGIDVRVFNGSWNQWSRAPERPVAVGRTPSDVLLGW